MKIPCWMEDCGPAALGRDDLGWYIKCPKCNGAVGHNSSFKALGMWYSGGDFHHPLNLIIVWDEEAL